MSNRRGRSGVVLWGAAAVALTAGGCSDGVGVGDAHVRVLLTDAPIEYVSAASVDIGAVELVGGGEGHATLTEDGTNGPVNLLTLQNAVTTILGEATIDAGTYTQLRLVVESASVTLAPGYHFVGGGTQKDLDVPSGAQTGIKLLLAAAAAGEGGGGLEIPPGEGILVVDFDVSQSFVIQGNPESPAGIQDMSFTPTLRVALLDDVGSISGTVTTSEVGASVGGLTVTAAPVDQGLLEEFQTQTATAVTGPGGAYTISFLVPGEYTVTVTPPAGFGIAPASRPVVVGPDAQVTGIDFQVVAGGP